MWRPSMPLQLDHERSVLPFLRKCRRWILQVGFAGRSRHQLLFSAMLGICCRFMPSSWLSLVAFPISCRLFLRQPCTCMHLMLPLQGNAPLNRLLHSILLWSGSSRE